MSRATAIHAVQMAMGKKLQQHERVRDLSLAGNPPSASASMRSALGTLDPDDGLCGRCIIVRGCDPVAADDHRHYWPLTMARRWRWNGQGLEIDGDQRPTSEDYDICADAIVAEVARLEVRT